jgi:hypothetical protein
MSVGATLIASLLATFARPSTWPLAMFTFLVRGGILLVAAPILVLPSVVGLGNVLAPTLTAFVFGGVTPSTIWLVMAAGASVAAWVVLGGIATAAAEAEGVRIVAAEAAAADDLPDAAVVTAAVGAAPRRWRIVVARWIAAVPLVGIAAIGSVRLVAVAYRELTVPSDTSIPVAVRVVSGAPEVLVALALAWFVGGIVAALATRHLVLAGSTVRDALGYAVGRVVRRPLRAIVVGGVPLVAFGLGLVVAVTVAALAAALIRDALAGASEPLVALLRTLVFVGLWAAGLVVVAVAAAWRAAAWTVEVAGTFGGATQGQAGDWKGATTSGTMADLRPHGVDPDSR